MGASSSALTPDDLVAFKGLSPDTKLDEISIPEKPENRVATNRRWSFVFLGFITILIPFLIYTLVYSDIRRYLGYDPCGNICGSTNARYDDISCSGADMTLKKYLMFHYSSTSRYPSSNAEELIDSTLVTPRGCVADCGSGYTVVFGICVPKSNMSDHSDVHAEPLSMSSIGGYLNLVAWQLTVSSFISLGLAIGMLFLFRYAVAGVVWSILIGCLVAFSVVVLFLWYMYMSRGKVSEYNDEEDFKGLLYINIILTIVVVVLILILIFARKKIWLVIALLRETTKAVFALPGIILVPVVALFVELVVGAIFVVLELYMLSAGQLENLVNEFYVYNPTAVMMFTYFFTAAIFIWVSQFIIGIKYMVVAGAVSDWYFAKNKQFLDGPIMRSAAITFKFHLGTIAFGSFIITIMALIRSLITSAIKNEHFKRFMDSCCESIETLLKYLSKNAYIVTALHGQPFIKSGRRAAKLLIQNVGDVLAINSIGDFVLGMTQLLIVLLSVAISYGLLLTEPSTKHNGLGLAVALFIIAILSMIIAATIFSVFETTIDTIFICFCEDSLLNDGMSRPYCMSTDLMEFVQNSKKIYTKS